MYRMQALTRRLQSWWTTAADGVHLFYDRMASFLAAYGNRDALRVAEDLDNKVETLLREAAA
jgi:hypothetical protein